MHVTRMQAVTKYKWFVQCSGLISVHFINAVAQLHNDVGTA
jgi:hypothetical protein